VWDVSHDLPQKLLKSQFVTTLAIYNRHNRLWQTHPLVKLGAGEYTVTGMPKLH